jgi:hypothetical protein
MVLGEYLPITVSIQGLMKNIKNNLFYIYRLYMDQLAFPLFFDKKTSVCVPKVGA